MTNAVSRGETVKSGGLQRRTRPVIRNDVESRGRFLFRSRRRAAATATTTSAADSESGNPAQASLGEREAPKQVIALRFGPDLSTWELIAPRRPRKSQPFDGIRREEASSRDAGSLLPAGRLEMKASGDGDGERASDRSTSNKNVKRPWQPMIHSTNKPEIPPAG